MRHFRSRILVGAAVAAATSLAPGLSAQASPDVNDSTTQRADDRQDDQNDGDEEPFGHDGSSLCACTVIGGRRRGKRGA